MKLETTYNDETQELDVTYRGETRRFKVWKNGNYVRAQSVFSGKFRTGSKLWPCDVTYWFDTKTANVQQGGFSNKGGAVCIVGWWEKDSASNSQHHGMR